MEKEMKMDSGGEVVLVERKVPLGQRHMGGDHQSSNEEEEDTPIRSCLFLYRKPLAVNALCLGFLLVYSFLGGFVFLHFEEPNWRMTRQREMAERLKCVEETMDGGRIGGGEKGGGMAKRIVERCVVSQGRDERMEWNLKNAVLFGFGILTTLGYGKIEPQTTHGRLFTVFYGFIGVPFTVIIFTNFGRYLQKLERCGRKRIWRKWSELRRKWRSGRRKMRADGRRKGSWILPPITLLDEGMGWAEEEGDRVGGADEEFVDGEGGEEEGEGDQDDQISPMTLICIVFLYLLLGAALIDWLDKHVDFPNGIYFAFLCLTAIEYGKLIPTDALYLPLVIAYICFGLAISTIALDIGSTYVKKLYYLGRKIRNIASIKIWFGAKHLRVRELLAALGHNIGLEPTVLCDLDLEQLISNAIQVKEGRLHRVPQTHMIMDGIWPPELVPLFLKDGQFPEWVDADERRRWSVASVMLRRNRRGSQQNKHSSSGGSSRSAALASAALISQPPERTPPLPPLQPDRLSVRFEEFARKDDEDRWLLRTKRSKLLALALTEATSSTSGVVSDPDLAAIDDDAVPSSWSLSVPMSADTIQMRRSETVPPSGHPDTSLFYMSNFPSMEMATKRSPLPPLTPLPAFEEEEKDQ